VCSSDLVDCVPMSKHRQDDKDVGIKCTKVQVQEGLL